MNDFCMFCFWGCWEFGNEILVIEFVYRSESSVY